MKVFFVTLFDAQNIRNWSGTAFYISKTLKEAGIEIEFIGNLESLPDNHLKFRLRNLWYNKILNKKYGTYITFYEPRNLQFIAKQVESKIKNSKNAIVFSPGTIPIAYLKTINPLVFWTDATFSVMNDYYTEFMNLHKRTIKNCHQYEQSVLTNADLAIYSSQWAANSAIKDYNVHPDKVKILPYGANIECERTNEDIIENNRRKSRDICRLLFIGQDWERKGANVAIEVADELIKRNIPTELTIVGCSSPPKLEFPSYIKIKGFIQKSDKEGENLMDQLYSESHFFILPTLAECTPIVFSEANSFGLPILTTSTGGIGSVIENDVNGHMFGEKMHVQQCASYIAQLFPDQEKYNTLSLKSFNTYLNRLNWKISIDRLISHFISLNKKNLSSTPK